MISVIIAAYNSEKYIAECLESVLAQTYKDLEIIVVDDGSIDNTWDIVQNYKKKDSRIVAIHQENQGPSAARNNAFRVMTGDYFTILDSDDWVDKNCYLMAMEAVKSTDADMVIWGFQRFDEKGTVPQKAVTTPLGLSEGEECRKLWLDFIYREGHRVNPFLHCRLVRMSLLKNRGLSLDPKLVRSEDFMLLSKLHFYASKVFSMESKLYLNYRQVEGSITHRYVQNYYDMVLRIYEALINFAKENDALTEECMDRLNCMLIYRLLMCVENELYNNVSGKEKNANIKGFISADIIQKALGRIGYAKGYRLYGKKYIALKIKSPKLLRLSYRR